MWQTIGHDKAINRLRRSLLTRRLSHAYLISGPCQIGKMTLALDLARAVNCLKTERPCGECVQCTRIARHLHADVRIIGTNSNINQVLIGIDQVREVQRESSLKPFEGNSRVFIFDGVQQLSEEAGNSLLKTLEEPPPQVILVLLTTDLGTLLPTLVSRCQVLELRHVVSPQISLCLQKRYNVTSATADEIAALANGIPGWAIDTVSNPDVLRRLDNQIRSIGDVVKGSVEERLSYAAKLGSAGERGRETRRQHLSTWLGWWRDVLLVKTGLPELAIHRSGLDTAKDVAATLTLTDVTRAARLIQQTIEYLNHNVNHRLALEHMMLAMPSLRGDKK